MIARSDDVRQAVELVQKWVEVHDYQGYEPFDGLSSWARSLTFGNLLSERILQQIVRQCPFNLRPLLGIHPQDSTKGQGYMAWGYLILYRTFSRREDLDKAISCLEWLDKHKVSRFQYHSWSNHFDFSSRGGTYTKDDPIIVWTALIGHAYLEAFDLTGESRFLEIAKSVCSWILQLPREKTAHGTCLSYLADCQSSIHNSNLLGAGLLARAAKYTGSQEYLDVARAAMEYSCSRQREDGSWWYAEADMYHWIDNFHTGYNLDSIQQYLDNTADAEFRPNLERGLAFYKAHFFEEDGCPKYYHTRKYPVDIQCVAQSIDTLSSLSGRYPECLELAQKVAGWAFANMLDADGFFYYRRYPLVTAKIPMLHWGQATMYKALTLLLVRLTGTATT